MEREELARLRDAENREEFAIRRREREMASEERALEEEMRRLEEDEEQAEHRIEEDLRREHSGHGPEQPPAWRRREGKPRNG